jgi:hypothetical protein
MPSGGRSSLRIPKVHSGCFLTTSIKSHRGSLRTRVKEGDHAVKWEIPRKTAPVDGLLRMRASTLRTCHPRVAPGVFLSMSGIAKRYNTSVHRIRSWSACADHLFKYVQELSFKSVLRMAPSIPPLGLVSRTLSGKLQEGWNGAPSGPTVRGIKIIAALPQVML